MHTPIGIKAKRSKVTQEGLQRSTAQVENVTWSIWQGGKKKAIFQRKLQVIMFLVCTSWKHRKQVGDLTSSLHANPALNLNTAFPLWNIIKAALWFENTKTCWRLQKTWDSSRTITVNMQSELWWNWSLNGLVKAEAWIQLRIWGKLRKTDLLKKNVGKHFSPLINTNLGL